jgi:hypothetical protein
MRLSIRILVTAIACLAVPAAAQAATPFTAGSGSDPTVAVGSDGAGHVVWVTTEENTRVGYCRLSPGTSSCNRTELLAFPGATKANRTGRAQVFTPASNKVVIVASCWNCTNTNDRIYRWISTNNGTSFGAPVEIGTYFGTDGFGTWLEDLEGGKFVGTEGSRVRAETKTTFEGVQYATGGLFVYGPEVARVPGPVANLELVAATNDLDEVRYGVYNPAGPHSVAKINSVSEWDINQTLSSPEPDNSDTALNSGPNGVFLTYRYFVPGDTRIGLRSYDPATNKFGAPTYLEGPDPIEDNSLEEPDSFQDPSGRIHVLWSSLFDGGRLRYTVSNTGGGSFTTPANLAKSESFHEPEIAAGADGEGFATWTPGISGAIRVVPLDPEAESAASGDDTTPPGISGFDIGDTTLLPGQGTKFTFRSTEAGLAVLTFEKRFNGVRGKRKGKRVCLPASKKRLRALRKKGKKVRRCKGFRRIGQIRQRVKPGKNTIAFSGRIAGRKLKPGQYRAKLVITDEAGQVSRTETLRFKVVKPKKGKRARR